RADERPGDREFRRGRLPHTALRHRAGGPDVGPDRTVGFAETALVRAAIVDCHPPRRGHDSHRRQSFVYWVPAVAGTTAGLPGFARTRPTSLRLVHVAFEPGDHAVHDLLVVLLQHHGVAVAEDARFGQHVDGHVTAERLHLLLEGA